MQTATNQPPLLRTTHTNAWQAYTPQGMRGCRTRSLFPNRDKNQGRWPIIASKTVSTCARTIIRALSQRDGALTAPAHSFQTHRGLPIDNQV
jgi:hypothetical protein